MNETLPDNLGIALIGFNRPELIKNTLLSLEKQNVLKHLHLWIDGCHGGPTFQKETKDIYNIARKFNVKNIHRHNGNKGIERLMLDVQRYMADNYSYIIFLEDDCFPVKDAISKFYGGLKSIENIDNIFSVYGHYFLVLDEKETISRFQGWGWGTTSVKLKSIYSQLLELYMLSEEEYLEYTRKHLDKKLINFIDVTPGRQPTSTLNKFHSWDDALCLICAMKGLVHKKTEKRVIYNCGAGKSSTHFKNIEVYRKPSFNMISYEEVWSAFEGNHRISAKNKFLSYVFHHIKPLFTKLKYYISRFFSYLFGRL